MNGSERGWDSEVDASLCKELEGKTWDIDGSVFIFKKAEKRGARTIRACGWGTEAFAVHATEKVTGTPWIIKLYKANVPAKRFRRLSWLISQNLYEWDVSFLGIPKRWVATQLHGRPQGLTKDFAGALLPVVPGSPWKEWKVRLESSEIELDEHVRHSLARQFVRSLALLERVGLTHGDISEGNVLVHVTATEAQLYLIDFDGFVYRPKGQASLFRSWAIRVLRKLLQNPDMFAEELPTLAPEDCRLTVAESGTVGTENYAPPDLMKQLNSEHHEDLAPDTDWHARDVFLVELLCWGKESCGDESPLDWDKSQRKDAATLLRSTGLPLDYLIQNGELRPDAKHRPTTIELAKQWSLDLPPERELVAVDPLVGRGGSKHDGSTSKTAERIGKILAYAALLVSLFLVYDRFFSSNRTVTSSTQPTEARTRTEILDAIQPNASSGPTNAGTTVDISKVLEEDKDPALSSEKRTDNAIVKPTVTPTIGELKPTKSVVPRWSQPDPESPSGILEQSLNLPGWAYQKTYKRSFLYNQKQSNYEDSLTFTLPRRTNPVFYSIALSANGERLGILRSDGYGSVFTTQDNTKIEHLYGGGRPLWHHLDLSGNGQVTAYSRDKNLADPKPKAMIVVAYAEAGKPSPVIESVSMNPRYFAVSGDGQVVAYADGKRSVTVVDIPDRLEDIVKSNSYGGGYIRDWTDGYQRTLTLSSPPDEFTDCRVANPSISGDGSILVVGYFETASHTVSVSVIDTQTMTVVWDQHRKMTPNIIFSPQSRLSQSGRYLVTYRADEHRFECVDLKSRVSRFSPSIFGAKFAVFEADETGVPTVVSFTPEYDEAGVTLAIWNPTEPKRVAKHPLSERIEDFAISSDGRVLAIVHKRNGTVSVYNAE